MSVGVDRTVSKEFEYVERMSREMLRKRINKSEVEGIRNRGRPCTRWLDEITKTCVTRHSESTDVKVM